MFGIYLFIFDNKGFLLCYFYVVMFLKIQDYIDSFHNYIQICRDAPKNSDDKMGVAFNSRNFCYSG